MYAYMQSMRVSDMQQDINYTRFTAHSNAAIVGTRKMPLHKLYMHKRLVHTCLSTINMPVCMAMYDSK